MPPVRLTRLRFTEDTFYIEKMSGNDSAQILITDSVHPVCTQLLEEAGFTPVVATGKTVEELKLLAAEAEGWIIRSGTKITPELIDVADRLKVIGRAGVGVDNVNLEAATHKGILVINAPAGNTISTAEHTIAMMLALSRNISAANASIRTGAWDRKSFMGSELYGKTLGIVGAGKIGRAVAERMRAFGMTILGYDPLLSAGLAEGSGIRLVPLEELIAESDVITVHTPLNDATRGILNDETLARCRPGVAIVNCARGGIVDEGALLRAIEAGTVGGAALDVYTSEPPTPELAALIGHDRVVATPHIAASTDEAQEKVARQVTEQVIHALRDEPVLTAVNAMAIQMAARPEVKPFLDLAERLGSMAQQLYSGRVNKIVVGCRGEVPKRYAQVLEVAALKGFMSSYATAPVNLVNAPILASETGITSGVETHEAASVFSTRLDVELRGDAGTTTVSGTLFGDNEPLVVAIDGYRLDVRPEGAILVYKNVDRPGMLAGVGAILAEAGINIAALALGRKEPGTDALTAVKVDDSVPSDLIARIGALEGIFDVCAIRL